jgi:hypothetical protein
LLGGGAGVRWIGWRETFDCLESILELPRA